MEKLAEIIGGVRYERRSPLLVWREMKPFGDDVCETELVLHSTPFILRLGDYGKILRLVQALL